MKIFGVFLIICASWMAFGGLALLLWLGEHYGGGFLGSFWVSAAIYFGGAPVVMALAGCVFIAGVTLAEDWL